MGWQLIGTAPKDGSKILLFCDGAIGIAAWDIINKDGVTGWWRYQAGSNEAAFSDYDPAPVAESPSHWRSLPETPK